MKPLYLVKILFHFCFSEKVHLECINHRPELNTFSTYLDLSINEFELNSYRAT